MNKHNLFSIGEAAKLFHLSVSSLRHYESAGLLTPEYTDPDTGYRYYSVRQFEVLNTIRYLRALDLPLSQIADFLQNRDVDRIEEKLRLQKEAVRKKLEALRLVERKIDNRLRQISDASCSELNTIRMVTSPACRMVVLKADLRISGFLDMEAPIRKLDQSQTEATIFLGKVGVGISAEQLLSGDFTHYERIFLVLDEEDQFDESALSGGTLLHLPETSCLCVRFRGSHPEAPEQYRRLLEYVRKNGLMISGFSREITLIDYGLTNDPEKFVTEIRIPVK